MKAATDESARLAEREGLQGKLCFPDLMRGVLAWREGDWDEGLSLDVAMRCSILDRKRHREWLGRA